MITSEEAIAKGTRRIVAVTGPEAERAIARADRASDRVRALAAEVQQAGAKLAGDHQRYKETTKRLFDLIEVRLS